MPLPNPVGRQYDVLYYPGIGHTVVLGTAGSGKTTLAILRAQFLASAAPYKGRTLLVTFNKLLVKYLRHLAGKSIPNLDIIHYHHFARGYLSSRGKLPGFGKIVEPQQRLQMIRNAIASVRRNDPDSEVLNA